MEYFQAENMDNAAMIICIITFVKIVMFYLFRLYSSIWKFASIHEMVSIIGAAFTSNAAMMGLFELSSIRVPESVIIITVLTDIFLIGGIRFAYRSLRRIINRYLFSTLDTRRILIIGNGESGAIVLKELKEHPELKSMPVAIIDDDKSKTGKKINGIPIVGQLKDICGVAREKRIDQIIIALSGVSDHSIDEIYHTCMKTGCKQKQQKKLRLMRIILLKI
jgi:FlaA1/EpsC-like NDP-sugar epimerase